MAIQIISNISQIIKICVSINLKKYIKINDFHVSFHNLQFFFVYFTIFRLLCEFYGQTGYDQLRRAYHLKFVYTCLS